MKVGAWIVRLWWWMKMKGIISDTGKYRTGKKQVRLRAGLPWEREDFADIKAVMVPEGGTTTMLFFCWLADNLPVCRKGFCNWYLDTSKIDIARWSLTVVREMPNKAVR